MDAPLYLHAAYGRVARALDDGFLRDDVELLTQYLRDRDPLDYRSRPWFTTRKPAFLVKKQRSAYTATKPTPPPRQQYGIEDHRVAVLVFGHILYDWLEDETKAKRIVAKRAQRAQTKLVTYSLNKAKKISLSVSIATA